MVNPVHLFLYLEICVECIPSVICLLYLAERDINSHVQAPRPNIWPANISVHLLVHNKNVKECFLCGMIWKEF